MLVLAISSGFICYLGHLCDWNSDSMRTPPSRFLLLLLVTREEDMIQKKCQDDKFSLQTEFLGLHAGPRPGSRK